MRPRKIISAEQIVSALGQFHGDVEAAARSLGVSSRTLYRRMSEYGIKPQVRYGVAA